MPLRSSLFMSRANAVDPVISKSPRQMAKTQNFFCNIMLAPNPIVRSSVLLNWMEVANRGDVQLQQQPAKNAVVLGKPFTAAWRATTKLFTAEDAKDAKVTKVVDVY